MGGDILLQNQELSLEDKRSALDFALQSDSLGRSDRLKSFLSYICEIEFEGHHERLTEYEIAISALGRRKDFSPIEDSTVRSRAYELRQKLERLYTIEAPDYPVQIDLPKGSYRPKFRRSPRPLSDRESSEAFTKSIVAEKARWPARLVAVLGFFVGVVATTIIAVLLPAGHSISDPPASIPVSTHDWTPELRELWAPFTTSQRPIAVIFETRLFVKIGPTTVVRDEGLERFQDVQSSVTIMQIKRLFHANEIYEARNYTDFGAANALFLLARLLAPTGLALKAVRSVDMTNDDLHSDNFVLLGKPGAYDGIISGPSQGFNFVYLKGRIRNLHPRQGEQQSYSGDWYNDTSKTGGPAQEYAVIRLTPGPEKGQHILNLISSRSELFWPLALCVTDPPDAKELVDHLRLPSGKLPDSYEVLIKIDERSLKPIAVSYVAHRILSYPQ